MVRTRGLLPVCSSYEGKGHMPLSKRYLLDIKVVLWVLLFSSESVRGATFLNYEDALLGGLHSSVMQQGEWPSSPASYISFTEVKHGCVWSEAGWVTFQVNDQNSSLHRPSEVY